VETSDHRACSGLEDESSCFGRQCRFIVAGFGVGQRIIGRHSEKLKQAQNPSLKARMFTVTASFTKEGLLDCPFLTVESVNYRPPPDARRHPKAAPANKRQPFEQTNGHATTQTSHMKPLDTLCWAFPCYRRLGKQPSAAECIAKTPKLRQCPLQYVCVTLQKTRQGFVKFEVQAITPLVLVSPSLGKADETAAQTCHVGVVSCAML
jgi:hypothetical protein